MNYELTGSFLRRLTDANCQMYLQQLARAYPKFSIHRNAKLDR
jgi:hypothetical protein